MSIYFDMNVVEEVDNAVFGKLCLDLLVLAFL